MIKGYIERAPQVMQFSGGTGLRGFNNVPRFLSEPSAAPGVSFQIRTTTAGGYYLVATGGEVTNIQGVSLDCYNGNYRAIVANATKSWFCPFKVAPQANDNILAVWDGAKLDLWLNGALRATATTSTAGTNTPSNTICFGRSSNGAFQLVGELAEFSAWPYALTPEQCAYVSKRNFSELMPGQVMVKLDRLVNGATPWIGTDLAPIPLEPTNPGVTMLNEELQFKFD